MCSSSTILAVTCVRSPFPSCKPTTLPPARETRGGSRPGPQHNRQQPLRAASAAAAPGLLYDAGPPSSDCNASISTQIVSLSSPAPLPFAASRPRSLPAAPQQPRVAPAHLKDRCYCAYTADADDTSQCSQRAPGRYVAPAQLVAAAAARYGDSERPRTGRDDDPAQQRRQQRCRRRQRQRRGAPRAAGLGLWQQGAALPAEVRGAPREAVA